MGTRFKKDRCKHRRQKHPRTHHLQKPVTVSAQAVFIYLQHREVFPEEQGLCPSSHHQRTAVTLSIHWVRQINKDIAMFIFYKKKM